MAGLWRRRRAGFSVASQGNVATVVAIMVPVAAAMVGGVVDYSRASQMRGVLQDSLDSATLAVARSTSTQPQVLEDLGLRVLQTNMQMNATTLSTAAFVTSADGKTVTGTATTVVPASVLGVFSSNEIEVHVDSRVARASNDIEVSLVLDTTGSMAGQKIIDLRAAANELIDIVVKDQQTPFYTKVAIVPYSMAVNAGSYATAARGSVATAVAITGVTQATTAVVTANNHGFANGARIYITGVAGMTDLNGNQYIVANKTANTFQLQGINSKTYSKYTSGGSAYCTTAGCEYLHFDNAESPSAARLHRISTCVTERTGTNAYTDVSPTTTAVGRNYPSTANPCSTSSIVPLSTNRTSLKASVNLLQASGSTGGHVGVGWGWYMVSPRFGAIFPAASRPAAYGSPNLIKAVVLMTDGEYNSSYCNGVISKDSTTGSGAVADHINCNAPNGHSFTQATALCTEMKKQNVKVYTVGFNIVNDQRARDLVNSCATDTDHVYLPSSGAELKTAFREIGQDLSRLRIAS